MRAVRRVAVLAVDEVVVVLVEDGLVAASVDMDVHVGFVREMGR